MYFIHGARSRIRADAVALVQVLLNDILKLSNRVQELQSVHVQYNNIRLRIPVQGLPMEVPASKFWKIIPHILESKQVERRHIQV